MSRPAKVLLGIVAVVVVLFVAIVAFIALRFDPDAYRPLLVDTVAQSTGRTLEIDGELGLDLFPCCAVELGPVRLGNPPGAPEGTFAAVRSAAASMQIWPLLARREVAIGAVRLDGVELELVRFADGSVNWEFEQPDKAKDDADTSPTVAGYRLDSIEITDGQLRYRDLGAKSEYRAADLSLATGAVVQQGALEIATPRLALTLAGTALPEAGIPIALKAGRVTFVPESGTLDLPGLELAAGATNATGEFAVADTGQIGFDLALDRLDLDAYLPKAAPEEERSKEVPAADAAEPTRLPLHLIRDLNVVGNVRAEELIAFRMRFTDVSGSLRAANDVLTIDPLTANLFQGRYAGNLRVDAKRQDGVVTLDQHFTGIEVSDLLKARFGRDVLAGTLTASLSGTGRGPTTRDLLATLAGPVELDLADGVYRGTDFVYELRRARAKLTRDPAPPKPENPQTPIDVLTMSGRLGEGVLRSDAITLQIPAANIEGSGDFDLLELTLDHKLTALLVDADQAGAPVGLGDLAGKKIPFTVKGPATDPNVRIDLQKLIKEQGQDALRRGLERLFGKDEKD
jgi:AsmA protein